MVASDSQLSRSTTRRFGQKVWESDDSSFAFGLSGDESTMQTLRLALAQTVIINLSATEIGDALAQTTEAVLAPTYQRVRDLAGDSYPLENYPAASSIVACYAADEPRLFSINELASYTEHASGVVAVGSGAQFAEHAIAVFRHLLDEPITLHQAKMLAYRIVEDTAEIAGPATAVGGDVQLAVVSLTAGQGVSQLLPTPDPEIDDAVDGWRRGEQVRFAKHEPPGPAA